MVDYRRVDPLPAQCRVHSLLALCRVERLTGLNRVVLLLALRRVVELAGLRRFGRQLAHHTVLPGQCRVVQLAGLRTVELSVAFLSHLRRWAVEPGSWPCVHVPLLL